MKNMKLFILLFIFLIGCKKDFNYLESIVGKWQLVKGYDIMVGGVYSVDNENQRIEEYTKNHERIRFDYLGDEIGRYGYTINETEITIFGKELNGQVWYSSYEYWLNNDTLKICNDGGFEFYYEFFVRIKK